MKTGNSSGDGATRATYSPVVCSPSSVQVASKTSVSERHPVGVDAAVDRHLRVGALRQGPGEPGLEEWRDGRGVARRALELEV